MWAQTYEERLRLWASLRESVADKSLTEQLNIINNWLAIRSFTTQNVKYQRENP